MFMRNRFWLGLLALVFMIKAPSAVAQPFTSSNYKVEEFSFGTGGDLDSASTTYKSRTSAGGLATGQVGSTSFAASVGNITPFEEYLEFGTGGQTLNLGVLSTATTATGTTTFYVRSYLSSGYIVQTISPPPTNESGNTLNPMSSGGASAAGTEQFGINLVANTAPATFGAVPVPQPDSSFASGAAAANYNTANQYRYAVGATIATGSPGAGQTNFTISYILNVSSITEEGLYTMPHYLVATATY